MNALFEKSSLRTIGDKFLHLQEFVFTASFETLRIMKDKFVVAPENEFILDVVYSALERVNYDLRVMSWPEREAIPTLVDPSTWDGSI